MFLIAPFIASCTGSKDQIADKAELAGSVSDYEQDEVLVFEPMIFSTGAGQSVKPEEPLVPSSDVHGGELVSVVHICGDGRPVWMRSMNDAPTIVVTPSAQNLLSSAPVDASTPSDEAVIHCVKQRYSGFFKAGKVDDGLYPWNTSDFEAVKLESENKE